MATQRIKEYLTVADYDRAKREATDKIISRQARGSIAAQNGWYIDRKELRAMAKKAGKSLQVLRAGVAKNTPK